MQPTSITDYAALLEVIRRRMAELELTYEVLDHCSGVQSGYSAKILGPTPCKTLGHVSFAAIIGALALRVTIEPDPEQEARLQHRWIPRRVGRNRPGAAVSESISPAAI